MKPSRPVDINQKKNTVPNIPATTTDQKTIKNFRYLLNIVLSLYVFVK